MNLFIIFLILSYLAGSVSSAIIVCKLFDYPDPRTEGSKNPGATNVLRVGGKIAAVITLLGDLLKGFVPVFIAKLLGIAGIHLAFVAFAAFLGHLYPIFFWFRGGKGVATLIGCVFALSWDLGLATIGTWLIVALFSRYSSLAAIIMACLTPFFVYWIADPSYFIPLCLMSLLLIWRHHENVVRLVKGKEDKLGKKKDDNK